LAENERGPGIGRNEYIILLWIAAAAFATLVYIWTPVGYDLVLDAPYEPFYPPVPLRSADISHEQYEKNIRLWKEEVRELAIKFFEIKGYAPVFWKKAIFATGMVLL
jgi:hypothetical protein